MAVNGLFKENFWKETGDGHGFDREIGRVNRHVLGAAVLMERRSLTKKMVFSLTVIPVWAPLPILYVSV